MADTKRSIQVVDLNSDHVASWDRVQQLRDGRREDEIPLNDDYWKALKKHRLAYQAGTLK